MFANLIKLAKISFLGLLAAVLLPARFGAAGPVYYSIHIASFKKLIQAESKVDSLRYFSQPVFLKKTEIPGEGRFYRVYFGKFGRRDDALAYWKKLKKAGTINHFGIHYFNETIQTAEQIRPRPNAPANSQSVPELNPLLSYKRFIDNQDGTVTDIKTNLMWIKNGWLFNFLSAVSWKEAVDRCKNFDHGGYNNWRLPSIEEWRSLIDTRNQNPALVEPNPFKNIISHMPYWSKSEYAYGAGNRYSQPSSFSYTVILYSGSINHQNKRDRAFVMPVRSIEVLKFHQEYSTRTKPFYLEPTALRETGGR